MVSSTIILYAPKGVDVTESTAKAGLNLLIRIYRDGELCALHFFVHP